MSDNTLVRIAQALERIADELGTQKKKTTRTKKVDGGPEVWELYEKEFFDVYKARPIRSAKVNTACTNLIKQVGMKTALDLVPYYLKRQDAKYTSNKHPITFLLMDAQKLKVDLETGGLTTFRKSIENERKHDTVNAVMEFARGD